MANQDMLIRMRLENQQAIAAARGFERQMRAVGKETQVAGRQLATTRNEMKTMGIGSRQLRGAMGQAGFQIADFAIVLNNGQNAMQAFAIQGGQLAGAFGPTGAIVGGLITVGGLIGAIAISSFTGSRALENMAKATDELSGSFGELLSQLEAGSLTADEISDKYGLLPGVFHELDASLTALKQQAAGGLLSEFLEETNLDDVINKVDKFVGLLGKIDEGFVPSDPSVQRVYDDYLQFWEELDPATRNAVQAVRDYNNAIENGNFSAQATAMEALHSAMSQLPDNTEGIVALRAALAQMTLDMAEIVNQNGSWLEAMGNLAEAFGEIGSMAMNSSGDIVKWSQDFGKALMDAARSHHAYESTVGRGRGQDPRQFEDDDYWNSRFFPDPEKSKTKKGGGRRGATELEKEIEELDKLRLKVEQQVFEFENALQFGFEDLLGSGIDGFVDMLFDAETSFKDFARSMLIEMGKMIVRQLLLNALMSAMGGVAGSPSNFFQSAIQNMAGVTARLNPDAKYAKGGILNGPTYLAMNQGKTGLAGEAGPEAIIPLKKGSDGVLGVGGPAITINNYAGADVRVVRSDDELIEIAVSQSRQAVAGDFARSMSTGHGTFAKGIENNYRSRRKAV